MNELEYSIDAKNVLNKFYGVEKLLYVEGEEDIPFWEYMFEKFAGFTVKVEDVGGKPELKKHAELVESGVASFLIAMDSDFDQFESSSNSDAIVYTYGYSIENTIVNQKSLSKVIRNLGRFPKKEVPEKSLHDWMTRFSSSVENLVIFDIINRQEEFGASVIPNSCDKFMETNKSYHLCERKIAAHLKSLNLPIDNKRIEKYIKIVVSSDFLYIELLRGHFLIAAAMRFVKVIISDLKSNISIPKKLFFGNMMTAFELVFDSSHPHYSFYEERISSIKRKCGQHEAELTRI